VPFDLDAGQGRWRVDLSVWLRDLHAHVARWLAGDGFPSPDPAAPGADAER
jgi:hypothetical protein